MIEVDTESAEGIMDHVAAFPIGGASRLRGGSIASITHEAVPRRRRDHATVRARAVP